MSLTTLVTILAFVDFICSPIIIFSIFAFDEKKYHSNDTFKHKMCRLTLYLSVWSGSSVAMVHSLMLLFISEEAHTQISQNPLALICIGFGPTIIGIILFFVHIEVSS